MSQKQRDKEIAAFERTVSTPSACAALLPGVEPHFDALDISRICQVFAFLVDVRWTLEMGEAADMVKGSLEEEMAAGAWLERVRAHASDQKALFTELLSTELALPNPARFLDLLKNANRALAVIENELEDTQSWHAQTTDAMRDYYEGYAQKPHSSSGARRLWYEDWSAAELAKVFKEATGRPRYAWIVQVFKEAFPHRPHDFKTQMLEQKVRRFRGVAKNAAGTATK